MGIGKFYERLLHLIRKYFIRGDYTMSSKLDFIKAEEYIENTNDLLSIVGEAGYRGSNKLLIHSKYLLEDFFDLKSGVAGEFLQKFSNYRTKVAILLDEKRLEHPRFKEMVLESNKQGNVAYFQTFEAGEKWLKGEGL